MVSTNNSFDDVTVLLRNRISEDVTSITDRFDTVKTIKTVTFAWPQEEKMSEERYPFIVVSSDDAEDVEFTYGSEEVIGRFTIEVAALTNDEASKIISECYNSIKTYKDELREEGITQIRLIDKDSDSDEFGGLNIRRTSLTFEFRWRRPTW
jgi:hypothetical protein